MAVASYPAERLAIVRPTYVVGHAVLVVSLAEQAVPGVLNSIGTGAPSARVRGP